jgi:hypothetical protein
MEKIHYGWVIVQLTFTPLPNGERSEVRDLQSLIERFFQVFKGINKFIENLKGG